MDNTSNFRPVGRRQRPNLLERARPDTNPKYICFFSEAENVSVYFHVDVLGKIYREVDRNIPNETIGLLGGRPCEDEQGFYTLVESSENCICW